MIRIIICDDHPIVRNGLKNLINDELDMTVVGESNNVIELFDLFKCVEFDLLILDISMPGMSGFEALYKIKIRYPLVKVLILSALSEDAYALKSLKAGASGFLNKESSPEELVKAVRKIQAGGSYMSPMSIDKLALSFKIDIQKLPHERLSEREFQILTQIGKGNKASQIANNLSLSVKTVSTYRARLLEKMALRCNSDIILYCIKEKLI